MNHRSNGAKEVGKHTPAAKRLLALLLALIMCVSFLAMGALTASASDPEGDGQEENQASLGYSIDEIYLQNSNIANGDASGYSAMRARSYFGGGSSNYHTQLTPLQQNLYSQLATGLKADTSGAPITLTLPSPIKYTLSTSSITPQEWAKISEDTSTNMQAVLDALLRDYPEIFWVELGVLKSSSGAQTGPVYSEGSGYALEVTTYVFNPYIQADPTADIAEVNKVVNRIKNGAASKSSDYDKVKYVHDELAKVITYANEAVGDPDNMPEAFGVNGALLNNRAVCEGYAKSFKLVCDELGIPCVLVSGTGYTTGGDEPHMWNYVKMDDGKWYAVDLTWDDTNDQQFYDFFLVGSKTLAPNFGNVAFEDSHEENRYFTENSMAFTYQSIEEEDYLTNNSGGTVEPPNPPQAGSEYYDVTPEANSQGWHNAKIIITPTGHNGYNQVGTSASGPFGASVELDTETDSGSVTLYFEKSGDVTTGVTYTYKLDKTPPAIGAPVYTQTKDKAEGTLTVSATDSLSGLAGISVSGPSGAVEQLEDGVFAVTESGSYIITARDNAGNTATHTEAVKIRTIDSITIVNSSGTAVSQSTFSGRVGDGLALSHQVVATTGGAQPDDYTVAWFSQNENVATVSASGAVKYVGPGRTNIIVDAMGKQDFVRVEITQKVSVNQPADSSTPAMEIPEESVPQGSNAEDLVMSLEPLSGADTLALETEVTDHNAFSGMEVTMFGIVLEDTASSAEVDPAGEVTITIPYPANAKSNYTFAVYSLATGDTVSVTKTASGLSFKVSQLGAFAIGYKEPGRSSSSSSGGGSSGGTSRPDSNKVVTAQPMEIQEATRLLDSAIAAAKSASSSTATVRFLNNSAVSLEVLQSMAKKAADAGVALTVNADVSAVLSVQTRLIFDPAKATKGISLEASYESVEAMTVLTRFQKYYTNKLQVLHLGQEGDFGMTVQIATKAPLDGMDTTNLVFYSYDKKSNTFQRIENPSYRIDDNGFLRFYTQKAGDIIISDGALKAK